MDTLLLILGLALILGGANLLTDGAAALAQRFRVPEFIIGLTIVAVGTSTPELVVSVLSSVARNSDVAIGNVVGSNLFNVFVILGVCALIAPMPLTAGNIRRDIPFGAGASLLLLLLASDRIFRPHAADTIGRLDGILGELFLRSATRIARSLGVSESVIAITLVAGGTSLPELASSVVSLLKGKTEMALGNVIGSNIANILLILGVSSAIHPLSMGNITTFDLLMVLLSSLLLLAAAFTFRRRCIDRWEGVLFLSIYGAYLWYLFR